MPPPAGGEGMHGDRAARLRRMSIPDNGETRPLYNVPNPGLTKSAPPGAGVKTRPYGRVLTPTPHWRLPAPAPGTQKKRTQLPGHGSLTVPAPSGMHPSPDSVTSWRP